MKTYIVLRDLPFAKRGEGVEMREMGSEWHVWRGDNRIAVWEYNWGDPIEGGWLEEKRRERWRAEKGAGFYFVTHSIVVELAFESQAKIDDNLWNANNYFRTEAQANEAAQRIQKTLLAYQEELMDEV